MKITSDNCSAFFDFDNTITPFDVFDNIVETFAVDKKWMEYESAWKRGEIGSKDCLSGQLKSVKVDKKRLEKHLAKIELDPHFKKIIALLKKIGVSPVIVSDSFRFFLEYILKNNGVEDLKIYSNRISFSGDRLVPAFPHRHDTCRTCGNCKKKHLPDASEEKVVIYVGDGLSDLCPAKHSDIVFAKGNLKRYLTDEGKKFFPFETLKDVYVHLSSHIEF
ncbi:MAG: MtnX-like HAD-IB family phosphatase [Candidatus Omnitrophota bacterium]|nr:MtnX-like HAD-IB family phosphatase [Candidatus Omnitrophota bacterium]